MTLLGELSTLVEPSLNENYLVVPAVNSNEGENELRWCPSLVTWSVGGIQKRKWTFKSQKQPVLAACFAWFNVQTTNQSRNGAGGTLALRTSLRFPSTFGPFTVLREGQVHAPDLTACAPTLCICICLRDIGRIFTHDGLEFIVNLPFAVEKIWPLNPVGLILQASLPSNTSVIGDSSPPFSLPYFTLITPHGELRPIVHGPTLPLANGPHPSGPNAMLPLDSSEIITYVSSYSEVESQGSPPFIVAVNRIQKRLRIFYYQVTLERLANANSVYSSFTLARGTSSVKRTVDSRMRGDVVLHEIWGIPLTETE